MYYVLLNDSSNSRVFQVPNLVDPKSHDWRSTPVEMPNMYEPMQLIIAVLSTSY